MLKDEGVKPCTHCGHEFPLIIDNYGYVHIHCPQCGTYFECDCTCGRNRQKDATIAAWNRRPADQTK